MTFSVIVPVYNVAPYLRECLDSVLAQTCADWECVCVDDGSTDGSGDILDEYAALDSRFRVIHKRNEGVAMARNAALDVIAGDWFLFLDSDDVWAPYLLDVCRQGIAFAPGTALIMFADKHFPDAGVCQWEDRLAAVSFYTVDMTGPFSRRWMGFMAQRKAYRRSVFADLREKNYVVGEDLLYMTECALRVPKMVRTDTPLYGYRDRLSSVTRTRNSLRKTSDHILSTGEIVALLQSSGREVSSQTRKELTNILIEDVADEYARLCVSDRRSVFPIWVNALQALRATSLARGVNKLRLVLMLICPCWPLWFFVALIPRHVKAWGLHR